MNNNNQTCLETEASTDHQVALNEADCGFSARSDISVLVAMERAGRQLIPVGCRGGGCGKCRIRILRGEYFSKRMSRAWISPEQEREGQVLACRVFARSDLLIEPDPPEIGTHGTAVGQSDQ
ncbi:2Fe-2S iron-sulfur cluster-binding protein [Marinobacterium marinum]|uniref:2Fe-2S iron-sulfur cluster binding domain-containing protein n=1 Tax=Marinobacterium marinum TaxID=2756129 RepID=A0A7W2AAX2_9GAMM|nr:2Fe-2S iron-sulfur cluster-binding protein [Marinobacterium marinum]MBA4501480.1 2Fe-2S iron-sulfur cluster binding domain-containing protein [Marinobacterium marinum]